MYDPKYMGSNPNEGNEIVNVLIRRDGMSPNEAWSYLEECRAEFMETMDENPYGVDAEEALKDYFGLEPDYIYDFIE